jgi:excisionase family DNA binding protein
MEILATSIKHTGETLGVGKTTVYALIGEGKLEAVKIGRRTLIKTASIRALINPEG